MNPLPIVLAGPIVRKVTDTSVNVWLTLSEPVQPVLTIYHQANSLQASTSTALTIPIAERIHMVMLTCACNDKLIAGERYFYDISMEMNDERSLHLFDPGVLTVAGSVEENRKFLVYPDQVLPSFRVPPVSLQDYRIAHGSCRKPHGHGEDRFGLLDKKLKEDLSAFDTLFLTGDQIYADDVDPVLFKAIRSLTNKLANSGDREYEKLNAEYGGAVESGNRQKFLHEQAGFTSTHADNHLMTFLEFTVMYLLVWSDSLWTEIPKSRELDEFRSTLPACRRVLANTSTYMIFDDHEITDDWNLKGAWVEAMVASDKGPEFIVNGLSAYMIFQHWGNQPELFSAETRESEMLNLVSSWATRPEASEYSLLETLATSFEINPDEIQTVLKWSYTIDFPQYRITALDTRTRRHFQSLNHPAGLMTQHVIDDVLGLPASSSKPLILLSPAPIVGLKLIEGLQRAAFEMAKKYAGKDVSNRVDYEAWSVNENIYQHLLHVLGKHKRVLVLSGDVHYAFGATLVNHAVDSRIVNFTSSSMKNEAFSSVISVYALSKYLSAKGGATLESVNASANPSSLAVESRGSTNAYDSTWDEQLLIDEITYGDITIESTEGFEGSKRRADVVGGSNVGLIDFKDGEVTQTVLWEIVIVGKETEHLATFDLPEFA